MNPTFPRGRSAKPLIARLKQQAAVLSLCVRAAEKISWHQAALLLRKLQQILRQLFLLRRMAALGLPLAAMTAVLAPAKSWGMSAAGSEFRVNTFTSSSQQNPSMGMDDSGNFIVVWDSGFNQDGNQTGVYAQRYNAAGVPQGGEFRVNTYTTAQQESPRVAMDADGDFVVVWEGTQSGGFRIYGQRFNAVGVAQGGEFQISNSTYSAAFSEIAMDADGDFVVVWQSNGQDGSLQGIYARRYNAAGTPQGNEFLVNSYTTSYQFAPTVAMDSGGNFVVAWTSDGQEGNNTFGIYAQRYDSVGLAQGGEFHVNTHTTNAQASSAVGMNADGDFVIAWESTAQAASGGVAVYAQRYNAAGVAQGGEFHVNTLTTFNGSLPRIAMSSDGDFIVTWEQRVLDGDQLGIYAQRYNAAGIVQGSAFRINTYTTSNQHNVVVGMDADGDFAVAWQSNGQDGNGYGIYGQRYTLAVSSPSVPDMTAGTDTGISNADNQTTDNTPTFTGTASAGITVYLYDGAALIGTGTVSGGIYTITSSPLAVGVHQIKAKALDAFSDESPFSGDLSVTIYASRQELWKQENFGSDADDPSIAGDAADPDNDGVSNLTEYALGTDPNASNTGANPIVTVNGGSGRLRIQFTRLSDLNDLNYIVQVSDDLATWTSIAQAVGSDPAMTVLSGQAVIVSETGTTTKTVIVEDNTSPAGPVKRFLRLIVSKL